jgi:hypothetical protein
MLILSRRRFVLDLRLVILLGLEIWLALGTGLALAQPAAGGPDRGRLRAVIEERYKVVPVQSGIVLVPRATAARGIESIELSDGSIAVDGRIVTGAELRERLPRDADLIIQLSYLDPAARQALFGHGRTEAPPAAPGPPLPAAEAPAAEEQPAPSTGIEPRRRQSDARIRIGGDVHVDEDEVVDGAVVVIGGSAVIDGRVNDDVVVVGGRVRLGPKADVRGDVTSIGGTIERSPEARVSGRLNDVGIGFPRFHIRPMFGVPFGIVRWGGGRQLFVSLNLFGTILRMLIVGLLAFFVLLVAREPVERIARAVRTEPWKSALVGFITQLLFLPLLVLTVIVLVVSIIGIPILLLVPFVIVALLVAVLVGLTAVAYRVGLWLEQRMGWGLHGPYWALFAGLVAIWVLTLLGRVVALGGWPVWMLASVLVACGFVVEFVAWTVGLGGVLLTRFGSRGALPPAAAVSGTPGVSPGGPLPGHGTGAEPA